MDLVIACAINNDDKMIHKVIASVPKYDYNNKFILYDGYVGEGRGGLFYDQYEAHKSYIAKKYPDFIVIEFDKNVYFRTMLRKVCELSNAERLLVFQDDVTLPKIDLKQIEIQMNHIKDLKILTFPHKYIPPEGTHWYRPFDDTYPLPFIKSHGLSERVFICDRLNMINILDTLPNRGNRGKRFVEALYYYKMNTKSWKNYDDDEKEEYWKTWGCYYHHDIYHKHLVAKRPSSARWSKSGERGGLNH